MEKIDEPVLSLRNRQRTRAVDLRLLRRVARAALREELAAGADAIARRCEISVQLVATAEMTALNEKYLRHRGSTDVITFDYGEPETASAGERWLRGEILVCVDEAVAQAGRFRTTWQSELVRYLIHGILHLCGYGDADPDASRMMKRQEDRLVATLSRGFPLSKLARRPRLPA